MIGREAIRLLFTLFIGIFMLAQPRGAMAAQDLLPSIQRIVARGALVIAVIEGSRPPMIRRGQDGTYSGFDVDLGKEIAHALGVKPQFVPAGPRDEDVIEAVASGRADIGLSYFSESVDAGKRLFFSRPYLIEAHTVFINRAKGAEFDDDCLSVSGLKRLGKKPGGLGMLDRNRYARLAKRADPDTEIRLFRDMESLGAAVQAGKMVASVQGELSAKYYLSRHPKGSFRMRYCIVPNARNRVAALVRPDAIDLLRWLDIYIVQRGVIIDLDTLLYRADRQVY